MQTIVLLIVFGFGSVFSLQVIPERANVTYQNPKYITNAYINVKRYSRRSIYYVNLGGNVLHTWTNNVTMTFIFYEYLHNEYRRSFIEMSFKFCEMINGDPFFGQSLRKVGVVCPLLAGKVQLANITATTSSFANVFPFEQGRINLDSTLTETGEVILKGYLVAVFKNDAKTNNG